MNETLTASGASTFKRFAVLLCVAGLLALSTAGYCDTPYAMAPPIDAAYTDPAASAADVFNWRQVPANQEVPVREATFDRGGYQLYDTVGETIVVPYVNNNLYVMKFGVSDNGGMYFVNDGDEPILYVPEDGYLVNASVAGARWYPFTPTWHPDSPVFLGCAPSWNDYIAMDWYPDMVCYGGYWCSRPFLTVGAVFPAFGLFFSIGGHRYDGWHPYWNYSRFHRGDRLSIVHANDYRWGGANWRDFHGDNHAFRGSGHPYIAGRGFVAHGSREFRGAGHAFEAGHAGGNAFRGAEASHGGNAFHGAAAGGGHAFRGAEASHGGNPFHGAPAGGGHASHGAEASHGGNPIHGAPAGGGHAFRGAEASHGGNPFHGAPAGGGHASHGAAAGGAHAFAGGGGHAQAQHSGGGHAQADHGGGGGHAQGGRGDHDDNH